MYSLCHHVLLTFVQANLAQRHSANSNVDGCSNETVDAYLVVQCIDVLGWTFVITDVFLSEGNILDQHSRFRTEEYSQHRQHYDSPYAEHNAAGGQFRATKQQRRHRLRIVRPNKDDKPSEITVNHRSLQ